MKINFYFLLALCLSLLVSCGDDDDDDNNNNDDAGTDLADVEFAFDQSGLPVDQTVIDNLSTTANSSSDPNALQIVSQLTVANAMSAWLGFFSAPTDAEQSDDLIGTCSGNNSVTYTWSASAGSESFVIAYEICETNDKYIFQVFWSINDGDFEEVIYAEQYKGDLRRGLMRIFAADPTGGTIGTTAILTYTWEESADGTFDFNVTSAQADFVLNIIVNPDNSGSMSWEIDGMLFYEATWNADGTSGTFTTYSSGLVLDEGNWPG